MQWTPVAVTPSPRAIFTRMNVRLQNHYRQNILQTQTSDACQKTSAGQTKINSKSKKRFSPPLN